MPVLWLVYENAWNLVRHRRQPFRMDCCHVDELTLRCQANERGHHRELESAWAEVISDTAAVAVLEQMRLCIKNLESLQL